MVSSIAVFGSSGAIGQALTHQAIQLYPEATLYAFSRQPQSFSSSSVQAHTIDYGSEQAIEAAINLACEHFPLDKVIVATGILHDDHAAPEKCLRDLSADNFHHLLSVNTVLPAIIAKYALPKLNKKAPSLFAALSARVGSISDNQLGGWYSYRVSKAALNMVIKTAAIEMARRNQQAVVVGLHPGTVDSFLSRPFQKNVPQGKLFTPEYAAQKLLAVCAGLTADDSGKLFAWDGQEVAP
ncbi:SDR family oxidoreductase [Candidatus Sororendozoicomonas aggregata]|uniref:SDR family oxidoreductase n=1 Tax=Candidatus Sororendozoicomonas aggregata TaxID=3073239 RepID=UPI002ED41012